MRLLRSVLCFSFLILGFPAWAQQAQTSQASNSRPPALKDAQAVSVLNQAVNAAGGIPAFKAIKDYTASGNLTYHGSQDVTNPVTLRAVGLQRYRIDSNLPHGAVSESIAADGRTGTKNQDGTVSWNPSEPYVHGQPVKPLPYGATPYQAPLFPGGLASPYHQLAMALTNPALGVFYKGMVEVDGHSAHDIQVGIVAPGHAAPINPYAARDFFIDASSFQLLMTRDIVPKNIVREIRYSDYRTTNGVLIPFSISEQMAGQKTRDIQLNTINFNAGLQDAVFTLQQ